MEKNDVLRAQSENGDALGGLSTEEIERLENYYILEAERLMAFGVWWVFHSIWNWIIICSLCDSSSLCMSNADALNE